jgi:hypothetical protein
MDIFVHVLDSGKMEYISLPDIFDDSYGEYDIYNTINNELKRRCETRINFVIHCNTNELTSKFQITDDAHVAARMEIIDERYDRAITDPTLYPFRALKYWCIEQSEMMSA